MALSILLILSFLLHAASPTAWAEESAIEELRAHQSASRDKVIHLNDATYKAFAKSPEQPRKYILIVFFDAVMLRDNPQLDLPGFRKHFGLVAKGHFESVEGKDEAVPVFFADIEYKESEATYRSEGIQSLPLIKLFGKGSDSKGVALDVQRFGKNFAGIVRFMKDNNIPTDDIKPPPPLSKTQMLFFGIAVITLTPFLAAYLLTHKTVIHDPRWWCLGGLCIYLFSVSGGMFNIIRNMPWFVPSREKPGTYVYFLQQSGNQFGVEGLVIGSFYTLVGLLTAFNIYVLPKAKSDTVKRVVGMLSIAACAFAVRKVVEFEVWKQGYWVHGFWPTSWK